jgi:hypothetical protein
MPATIDFVARYERGQYEAVWAELDALGATLWDEPVYSQAHAVGIATMRRVAENEPIATGSADLRDALAAWRALPVPLRDPLELRLGPSRLVKYVVPEEGPEGPDDDPPRVLLDEPAADPAVRGAGFDVSFVAYLRQVVGGGGFGAGGDAALREGATAF